MSYNATRKVRTKDLKSLASKTKALNDNVKSSIGTLSSLSTSNKTSLVAAINELESRIDDLELMASSLLTAINASMRELVCLITQDGTVKVLYQDQQAAAQ